MNVKKIYIVEDFVQNLNLFKAIFKKIDNVEIFTESDGIKGFEMIKSGNPDIVILDYDLPNLDGLEICKKLRKIKKFKNVKIIAVSSTPLEKGANRETVFKEAGFDILLSKPIKVKEFKEIIVKLITV